MAPKKAKKGTPAPTSKVPVKKPRGNPLPPGKTHDGRTTRAEKKVENKAVHAATVESANKLHVEIVETTKISGKALVGSLLGGVGSAIAKQEGGRPWLYQRVEWSEALGDSLYALMATGHSLREIAEMDGMPPLLQLAGWIAENTHGFAEIRARAKSTLVPIYEELAETIAARPNTVLLKTRKQVITKDGDRRWVTEYRESDGVERSKLALQGIQWTLGHLKPKKHGRAPDLSGSGKNEQLEGLFAALKAGPKE